MVFFEKYFLTRCFTVLFTIFVNHTAVISTVLEMSNGYGLELLALAVPLIFLLWP
jgi:hypothetical protein